MSPNHSTFIFAKKLSRVIPTLVRPVSKFVSSDIVLNAENSNLENIEIAPSPELTEGTLSGSKNESKSLILDTGTSAIQNVLKFFPEIQAIGWKKIPQC